MAGAGIPMIYDNPNTLTSDVTGFEVESEKQYDNHGNAQPAAFNANSAIYDNGHNSRHNSQNGHDRDAFDMSK